TGTVKLRALFDNKDEELFPNQFVNAKLTVDTVANAALVPNGAILQGTPGTYVYLMDGDAKVSVRPIKTGETDGTRTVVLSGLQAGDRVVTDGTDRLRDGAPVRITEGVDGQKVTPAADAGGAQEAGQKRGRRRQQP
ncbi:MAG: efflux transporter periplasmic adaptor subunit, partial [Methylobacterium sp.]